MQKELDSYLAVALKKLEAACAEMFKKDGAQANYSKETEKMRMLIELTKEQVKNENTRTAAR